MKIAYVTAQTPYGKGEQFILPEIIELAKHDNDMMILPLRPNKKLGHGKEAKQVSKYTINIPLFNFYVLLKSVFLLFKYPIKVFGILKSICINSGNMLKIMKNMVVIPKGLLMGEIVKRAGIEHIHAHWASTPATAAYIAACISGIPWSFTCHRWDIAENNMLKEKVKSCKFVRAINRRGFNEIINITGTEYKNKCHVIHMGINIKLPNMFKREKENRDKFIIATPANLVEVKGHKYLIKAVKQIIKDRYNVVCKFYGDGHLKEELQEMIEKENLQENIFLEGQISHDELINLYEHKKVDCVILPSVTTESGEKEGIPVSLMEAMAHKISVVSTNTGGIPELLSNEAGIIVEQKNPEQIKNAVELLIDDGKLKSEIENSGYNKVCSEFNSAEIANDLIELF